MNEDILRFKYGPGKIVVRPIISQDETMTIYGKEQEFGEVKEMETIIDVKEENNNELKVFDVTDTNDETKEFCSEECMLKGLRDIMVKDKTLGRCTDLRLESYKYEYEHEEEKDETAKPCI